MLSKSEEEQLYKQWREDVEQRLRENPDFARWYSEKFGTKPLPYTYHTMKSQSE